MLSMSLVSTPFTSTLLSVLTVMGAGLACTSTSGQMPVMECSSSVCVMAFSSPKLNTCRNISSASPIVSGKRLPSHFSSAVRNE